MCKLPLPNIEDAVFTVFSKVLIELELEYLGSGVNKAYYGRVLGQDDHPLLQIIKNLLVTFAHHLGLHVDHTHLCNEDVADSEADELPDYAGNAKRYKLSCDRFPVDEAARKDLVHLEGK